MKRHQSSSKALECKNASLLIVRLLLLNLTAAQTVLAVVGQRGVVPLCVYLAGLISGLEPSAHALAYAFPLVSHDAITRMLSSPCWSRALLIRSAVALANTLSGTLGPGWLCLDDVHIPKPYAKLVAFAGWDYDHASKRNVFGLRQVVLLWCNDKICIPLGFFLWQKDPTRTRRRKTRRKSSTDSQGAKKTGRKPRCSASERRKQARQVRTASGSRYRSKNELARALVWRAVRAGIEAEVICFDNWYASRENIDFFSRMGLKFVTSLKKNTKVEYEDERLKVEQVGATVKKANYHYYGRIQARARSFQVKGFNRTIRLTVVKDDSHPDGGHVKYLATNLEQLTTMQHVAWYRRRWPIEVFFRDCKQLVGLCECQARRPQPVITHLILVMVGYVILQLMKTQARPVQVSVNRSQNALLTLRVLTVGATISLVHQKPSGCFEPVDLTALWEPIRTRLPENHIPEAFSIP